VTPVRTTRYVALLRGINVGGRNLIRMPALKACFEKQGYDDVVTYIQSGNVLFSAAGSNAKELAGRIERELGATFGYDATVLLRTRKQMQDVLRRAPAGFGDDRAAYRYDVLFLREPLTSAAALTSVPTQEGVDEVHAGPDVLYFSRLISKASSSRLSRIASMPIYKSITIRNWNTTTKLSQMMGAEGE
jgi:uncharacterized protein (DUF1697 family)